MSIDTVERVLWDVNFKPEVMAKFRHTPEALLDQYPLEATERELIRRHDVRALADRGASQMLLMMVFQTLNGGPQAMPEYMRRMNTPGGPAVAKDELPAGGSWRRGDPGYEEARVGTVWNGFKPARYPAVIVRAETAEDVCRAVRHAVSQGLKVKARSGGHNWTASFLRDDAMLIDLGALNTIDIYASGTKATLGPAVTGRQLQAALAPRGRFFPTGHCSSVAVGGYLLQGGWGWNVPSLGLANNLIESMEVVTAQGDLIHVSATENPDYFWAAHGAGAGFFGIVTAYHLKVLPLPHLRVSASMYTREQLDAVLHWATRLAPSLPASVEMNVFMMPGLTQAVPGAFALVNMMCFDAVAERAEQTLRDLDTCPLKSEALMQDIARTSTVTEMYDQLDQIYVEGWRFGADNMFTDAPADEVVAAILKMVENIPTPMSHVLWHPYPLERVAADTTMSIMGTNYLVGYGACIDPADDPAVQSWATTHMKAFEPIAVGMQLGDENRASRPDARFLKGDAPVRLEALRRRHDPEGLFLGYWTGQETR